MRFVIALLTGLSVVAGCGERIDPSLEPASIIGPRAVPREASVRRTFGAAADAAMATLEHRFYHPPGRWNACVPNRCGSVVDDWGADSLTYALFLRWRVARDPSIIPIMNALVQSAPTYKMCEQAPCTQWSDIPMWDAVAAARAFEVTGDRLALTKAKAAFDSVDQTDAFARGACPNIDFQLPAGGKNALKTLETDSNYIKAALLLGRLTGAPGYVRKAQAKYAAVRRYFLDPAVALYSVYVFDDGSTCTQLPRRYFASVNGNMIDNGLALARQTGDGRYRRDAIETAHAVARNLSDPVGVYADLQADNDVAEPLIEAMNELAVHEREQFARRWLLDAAAAAQAAPSGAYGRFFDGPAPAGPISAWSASGGLALAIAAGSLDPSGTPRKPDFWTGAQYVADPIASAPASIAFSGRAIALIGTIGDVCCEAGHVRVFIDGNETYDSTGIWQNKSPAAHGLAHSVLLSWRWPRAGRHTVAFAPGIANAKEGGSFIHIDGYELMP